MAFLQVILLLAISFHHGSSLYVQYFQGHPLTGCIGTPTTIFETNLDLVNEGGMFQAKSASSRGLWRFTGYNSNSDNFTAITTSFHTIEWNPCTFLATDPQTHLSSAENLLPGELEESVLLLTSQPLFNGISILVRDQSFSLPAKMDVYSWSFTGPEEFTVWDGPEETGNATCLRTDEFQTGDLGWGITSDWLQDDFTGPLFTVASVRRGYCSGKSDKNVYGRSKKNSMTAWDVHGNDVTHILQRQNK